MRVSSEQGDEVVIYIGLGWAFQVDTIAIPEIPHRIRSADVDGDGAADIIVPSGEGDLQVLAGSGDGSFQPPFQVTPGGYPSMPAIGDLATSPPPSLRARSTPAGPPPGP